MRRAGQPGSVLHRANVLLDAWLRGINQGGHIVTPEDIKAVFLVCLRTAKHGAKASARS